MATYVVKPGDSLSKIAKALGVPVSSLTGYKSGDPNKIAVGETLSYGNTAPKSPAGTSGITNQSQAYQDALKYGAAGRGEYDNSAITKEATGFGVPMSEIGDYQSDPNYRIPTSYFSTYRAPVTLSGGESKSLAKQYGLAGIADDDYAGLTRSQAQAKAAEKQAQLKSQTSALTSYTFNPKTIAGFNQTLGNARMKMDSVTNDPWVNKNEKKDKQKAILESFTDQFAGLFGSSQEFEAAMQNPDFQKSLMQYQQMGGNVSNIAAKITANPSVEVTGEIQNPDGSWRVQYSDGYEDNRRYVMNPDGTYTAREVQTLDDYLGAMKNPSDRRALESLIPEKEVYQEQIALEQSIPEQYRELYFGTPQQVGLVQQRRKQAEEEIKLLEVRAKTEEHNMRAQANFAIERNQKQLAIEADQVEENRLAAKNYMTGMLAKLGALNTTGAAPQAIATLEQKYQAQAQKLRTSYEMENREIELKLNETVDEINLSKDEEILKTKGDLSKTEEDIWKEVFKLQNEADRKTLGIVEKYTLHFKTQREKFAKEAKLEAEKNAKAYAKLAAKYDAAKIAKTVTKGGMEGGYTIRGKEKGILMPDGTIKPFNLTPALAQEVENAEIFGEDAIKFFTATEPAFRDYLITSDKLRLNKAQLKTEYDKWKAEKAKKGKTPGGREY